MSQTSTDAQIVAEFQDIVTSADIFSSMAALAAYEYIITLRQEVTIVSQRKWTLATWLLMANRYLLIGFIIWTAAPYTSSYVVYAVFSALRVFALWDRNVPMTLLVLALNLVPVAVNITRYSARFAITLSTSLTGSILIVLGDALVLAVTWLKTARNLTEGARIGMRTPLSTMLLRDGTIYFAVLLMMNIALVVILTVPSFQFFGVVSTVIGTLQPILISRFLLNLRQVGSPENDSQEAFNSQFSVPGFCVPTMESIIGNMGENLDHGGPTEEVEDEVENISGSVQAEDVEAENTSGSVQAAEVALPEIAI
ncbi:hypothetical protein EW026_g6979 [Hermanssonia centrifuga]|uniref:DUF6533 domain-containing protein n=1 Tax=Hermanssonia centrifuga TaxID=98765 RepID=A0A4S4K9A2_9APHY|nr:hypothetical protein EW026_g6979 [Hermanssonia centrifuga]